MTNSSSRSGAHVIWVTVHTAEGIRKASDLKAFFEHSTNSSAHAVADDSTLLDNLVPYDRAAWTLRNGNSRSDNLELCGFAAWSRDEWIGNHQGMLNNTAAWVRSRCLARGVPIVKLSAADVKAGRAGVIGHVDYTNGTGDGTHWDPGPGFPWDIVIARAGTGVSASSGEEDDMTPDQVNTLKWLETAGRTLIERITGDPEGDPNFDAKTMKKVRDGGGHPSLIDGAKKFDATSFAQLTDATTYKTSLKIDALSAKLDALIAALDEKTD